MKMVAIACVFALLLIAESSCTKRAFEITELTISKNSKVIKKINDKAVLDKIAALISDEECDENLINTKGFDYSLYIDGSRKGRWLYNSISGQIVPLTYRLRPCYKIKDNAAFKELISNHKNPHTEN